MKILDYTEVMAEKIENRKSIPEIKYDVHGHCIHIGKISTGCFGCFANVAGGGIQVGTQCMCNCPMCYYDSNRNDRDWDRGNPEYIAKYLGEMTEKLHNDNIRPYGYSYQSSGETLLYVNELEKFAKIFEEMEKTKNIKIYHHLYTNGILANKEMLKRLKNMRVHEIRFHVSASHFSKKVINNMYEAAKMGFRVSIEEPSWPLHRDDLFDMLPILEDVGGSHLNIVECQVTQFNIENIKKYYPGLEHGIYKDLYWHLYDNGMVYDIMREVLDKKYSYSVLDCNSGVERCRGSRMHHVFDHPSLYGDFCLEFPKEK